jgi:ribose 5-phosphate isomerase A
MDEKILTAMKINVAKAALDYIKPNDIIGIGTGSTVNCFIESLATVKHQIGGAVASSNATAEKLKALKIPVLELNAVDELPIYIDSADAYNSLRELVKGGGGALTREKILATAAKQFICIVDANKKPGILGTFPVPIEVLPMARSFVAREIVKLGGQPQYRNNFVTDNGNIILDVYGWQINKPIELETTLNQIAGVVSNGIFAARSADIILIGSQTSIQVL